MWIIFYKPLLILLQYCFYFMCFFFCFCFWLPGMWGLWVFVPQPRIEPTSPASEGKVLATGPPGNSLGLVINDSYTTFL